MIQNMQLRSYTIKVKYLELLDTVDAMVTLLGEPEVQQ